LENIHKRVKIYKNHLGHLKKFSGESMKMYIKAKNFHLQSREKEKCTRKKLDKSAPTQLILEEIIKFSPYFVE